MNKMDPQTRPEDVQPEEIRPDYVEHNNAKYIFDKKLGKGAFGFVYLYRHPT
jgi:hypothetical protein